MNSTIPKLKYPQKINYIFHAKEKAQEITTYNHTPINTEIVMDAISDFYEVGTQYIKIIDELNECITSIGEAKNRFEANCSSIPLIKKDTDEQPWNKYLKTPISEKQFFQEVCTKQFSNINNLCKEVKGEKKEDDKGHVLCKYINQSTKEVIQSTNVLQSYFALNANKNSLDELRKELYVELNNSKDAYYTPSFLRSIRYLYKFCENKARIEFYVSYDGEINNCKDRTPKKYRKALKRLK